MSSLLRAVDPLRLFREVFDFEVNQPRLKSMAAIRAEHERRDRAIVAGLDAARQARAEAKANQYMKHQVCKIETYLAMGAVYSTGDGGQRLTFTS